MSPQTPFSIRLQGAMDRARISGNELARRLNTAQSTVQGWTAGRSYPGGEFMIQLPAILNVSGHWLLTEEGPPDPPAPAGKGGQDFRLALGMVSAEVRQRIVVALQNIQADLLAQSEAAEGAAGKPSPAATTSRTKPTISAGSASAKRTGGARRLPEGKKVAVARKVRRGHPKKRRGGEQSEDSQAQ